MAYTQADIVNTEHINTVEVKVAPPMKDTRQWVNSIGTLVGASVTAAAAVQGTLSGFAWFAPALAALSFLNQMISLYRNKGVESKNVRVEEIK